MKLETGIREARRDALAIGVGSTTVLFNLDYLRPGFAIVLGLMAVVALTWEFTRCLK